MHGVVYDPPKTGLPYIAVIFNSDWEVVVARSVPSLAAGEALIGKVVEEFAASKGMA